MINVRAEKIDIDSVSPHPSNPRLGDVEAIAESLQVNGQYSPIVVWNNTIIAGTHTWRAAKSLGWDQIAATKYEGSETDALRILVADNRTSDVATYNDDHLITLLRSLPDLEGTGYDLSDLDEFEGLNGAPDGLSGPLGDDTGQNERPESVTIRIGEYFGNLDPEIHAIWLEALKDAVGDRKAAVVREIRARLDIPSEPKAEATPRKKNAGPSPENFSMEDTELVSLDQLVRFPGNPREGDIGAISESLRAFGQYRPVIVNRRTNQILKGNHTAAAASALGWAEVAVTWVDVDDEAATRIVLADNRTSDKASYNDELLVQVLTDLPTLEGTGYDIDDYLDTAAGKNTAANTIKKAKFKIGDYGFSTSQPIFDSWVEDIEVPNEVLRKLGIPSTALMGGSNYD